MEFVAIPYLNPDPSLNQDEKIVSLIRNECKQEHTQLYPFADTFAHAQGQSPLESRILNPNRIQSNANRPTYTFKFYSGRDRYNKARTSFTSSLD